MAVNSRHQPDPSEVLSHLTEMFMATLNPYFAWAVARLCYEEELDLPHEVLIYFGTVATLLIGKDSETDLSLYEDDKIKRKRTNLSLRRTRLPYDGMDEL